MLYHPAVKHGQGVRASVLLSLFLLAVLLQPAPVSAQGAEEPAEEHPHTVAGDIAHTSYVTADGIAITRFSDGTGVASSGCGGTVLPGRVVSPGAGTPAMHAPTVDTPDLDSPSPVSTPLPRPERPPEASGEVAGVASLPLFKPIEQCETVGRVMTTADLVKELDPNNLDVRVPTTLHTGSGENFQNVCLYAETAGYVELCYERWRGNDGVHGYNYPAVYSRMYAQADGAHDIYRLFHETFYDGDAVALGRTREPAYSISTGGCYPIDFGFSARGVSLGGTYNFCPEQLTTNYARNLHAVEWYANYRPNMINPYQSYAYDTTHMIEVRDGLNSGINFGGRYWWLNR